MTKVEYRVIGVMSGTSLDGIDLAYVSLVFDDYWSFEILKAETVPYPEHWSEKLQNLVEYTKQVINFIDEAYTEYLGAVISDFIQNNNLKDIDAICSHGHTALHQPENGFTYQIGNLPKLAKIVHRLVVCDFRVQDVAFGGQGAPLVPIGDELLFSEYDYCLNLGGFANVSNKINEQRIAYDICPVNIVMNHYTKQLGLEYDDDGKLASQGTLYKPLLDALNAMPFYSQRPPKSLGLEWVIDNIFPLVETYELEIKDILRTFVEHIAIQISKLLDANKTVLITGGGAYNSFLINRIRPFFEGEIIIPEKDILEYKEAVVFGLLGVLKLRNETNCLASVTGAKQNHSSGVILHP